MRRIWKWGIGVMVCSGLLVTAIPVGLTLYLQHKLDQHHQKSEHLSVVVGMPDDGLTPANIPSYSGPHPSLVARPQDPFSYPIPQGGVGPTEPLYAGPNQYPFLCRTEESELGQPLVDNQEGLGIPIFAEPQHPGDERRVVGYSKDCLLPTRVAYYYNRAGTDQFFPLDEAGSDMARIEINGEEIDFVVRVETGTINRFIYQIAALRGPNETLDNPDPGHWNRRLVYQFRGGVGVGRRQGRVTPHDLLTRRYEQLKLGYAVAYSSANQTSNHYNLWLAEDTALRVKRQFNALYGPELYTVGIGGSGGALQQYLLGQNMPGLIDAAIPLYSYPDMVTQTIYAFDCELLEYYFDITASDNDKWRDWENRQLIEGMNARMGFANERSVLYDLAMLVHRRWPHLFSGMSECVNAWRGLVQLVNNPTYVHYANRFATSVSQQVHWTHWDDLRYLYGTDDQGYARHTWDNVGVQYGLTALRKGVLTPDEFLRLNARIGSWKPHRQMQRERYWVLGGDADLFNFSPWGHQNMNLALEGRVAPRMTGDLQAMAAAYRAGLVFVGRADIPIIDVRHYLEDELDMHHASASFSARQRLLAGQGHADNQLIWMTSKPHSPVPEAFAVIDRWMLGILASADRDVVRYKPSMAQDRCYDDEGRIIAAGAQVWDGQWNSKPTGACMQVYPIYSESRSVAGAPLSGDLFKCRLQSVDQALSRGLYGPTGMGAYRDALQRVFPEGVCDYTQSDLGRPGDLFAAPASSATLSLTLPSPAAQEAAGLAAN